LRVSFLKGTRDGQISQITLGKERYFRRKRKKERGWRAK
jgi:hypothetical protein